MLSSVSEFEYLSYRRSRPVYLEDSGESPGWWIYGSNGVCGRCDPESGPDGWWSTNDDGLCVECGRWSSYKVAEDDDQVFKLDNLGSSNLVLKLDNLGFPSSYNFRKISSIHIVGSCNGLICLHDSYSRDVSLWNPATNQFRILPKSITIDGERLVAFGFDAETLDYKVVLVSFFRPVTPSKICRVEVYSLSTDSWRLLEGINVLPGYPFPYPDSSGLYLNGRFFFMAKFSSEECIPENNDRFIISFDFSKEIFIPIQLPHHDIYQGLYLCYLGEKIALFTVALGRLAKIDGINLDDNDPTGCYEDFHIWVLDEHGSSSSSSIIVEKKNWTELHWFRIYARQGKGHIPRGISDDGEFALLETRSVHGVGPKKMKLYNLVTHEVRKKFLSCDHVLSNAYAYKPSLVSIIGGEIVEMAADRVIGNVAAEMDWKRSCSGSSSQTIGCEM